MASPERKKCQIKATKPSGTTTMAPPAPPGVEKKPSGPLDWLFCSVCEGIPKYSDVSHLLTHISSKGHLHAFSQAEIRALNNPEAEKTIQNFKNWEVKHGIKNMLASRLAAKESKDAIKRRRAPTVVQKTKGNAAMKIEADDEETFMYAAAGASQTGPYYTGNLYGPGPRRLVGSEPSFGVSTPASMYSSFYDSRKSSTFSTQATESGDGNVALSTEAVPPLKLKGVTWPGMSIFDAASDDMKRKRNQRKDDSVTERLLASSKSVTTEELVFNAADFSLVRRRDVYDSPSPPPEDTEGQAATNSTGNRGKKRRAAKTQAGRVTKKRAARTGRVTRSRARVTGSTPKSDVATPDATTVLDDDDDDSVGAAIDAMGAEEAMEDSLYMAAGHYADASLMDPKNESHMEDGMYSGGMPGSVHDHLDFGGDAATMGQNSGIEHESKRLNPSYHSPSSNSLTYLASPQSCTTEQTIDPALLTPPSANAETQVDRQDASGMTLVDMPNHAMHTSPSPPRMSLNRAVSYQNMHQSPPGAYYCSTGPFHGNTNPLCPRPSHGAAGYSVYSAYTQANPMYMHSHGHPPPPHGFPGMVQYGNANDTNYADPAPDAANTPGYRVN